jgi:putative transposase
VRFTPRKKLPHEVPFWVQEGSFFFITIKCEVRGQNQLCHAGRGDAILAAAGFYHEQLKWHCRLMLLMPDHVHAIIAFPNSEGMKRIIGHWKRFLNTHEKTMWQDDFFDHRLRNRHEETEKIDYILNNPVRQGLCERIEDWPWIFRPADRPPPLLGD